MARVDQLSRRSFSIFGILCTPRLQCYYYKSRQAFQENLKGTKMRRRRGRVEVNLDVDDGSQRWRIENIDPYEATHNSVLNTIERRTMVLDLINKMLQRPSLTTTSPTQPRSCTRTTHPWTCGRDFRVDSLSPSQHDLLTRDGPPPSDYVTHDQFFEQESLPVVDMALIESRDAAMVEQMVAACEDWGYFFLVNHGVDLKLMEKVEQQAYEFFSMSVAEKKKHARSGGWAVLEKVKRWSEGVVIQPWGVALDEYDSQLSPPENNHEFSSIVKEYDAVMKTLAMRIVKLLVSGVGIKAWRFDEFLAGVEATLRWNYQPRCPRPENAMALCPHRDPYLVTLQHDNSGIGGLQVWRKERWLGVPPRADALIVNVGDAFEILTNGKFKSPTHRTVVNEVEGCLSVAHCLAPAKFATLTPPPEILRFGPNLFKQRTYAEYLAARKALDSSNSLDFMKLPTSV